MKAILIVEEMPSRCSECLIYNEYAMLCLGGKVKAKEVNTKPSWCSLKPLPPKKDINFAEKKGDYYEMYTKNYVQGWNDFRDEILGGEE